MKSGCTQFTWVVTAAIVWCVLGATRVAAEPATQGVIAPLKPSSDVSAGGLTPRIPGFSDVPFPFDASRFPEPRAFEMAGVTLRIYGFAVTGSWERMADFYEQAFPASGWHLGLLPWQAHHVMVTERLERWLRDHAESPQAPELRLRLAELQRTTRELRRQLYASRGDEHLIVQLWSMTDGGTVVFLNRWTGDWPLLRQAVSEIHQ